MKIRKANKLLYKGSILKESRLTSAMKILLGNKFDVTRIVQRIIDSNIISSSGRTLETRGKSLSKTTFEHRRTGANIFGEAVLVLPELFCFCPKKKTDR